MAGNARIDPGERVRREFSTNALLVANKDNFYVGKIPESLNSAGNWVFWGKIPTHGVEGDFHPAGQECLAKLFGADRENLAFVVVAAGRTGSVTGLCGAALRAFAERWSLPAVGCLASAQAHF